MEDSLTLDELMVLYEAVSERQMRLIQSMTGMFGGGVSFDSDQHSDQRIINSEEDVKNLPFGLGYEKI